MQKPITLLISFFYLSISSILAQNYVVQVGAFNTKVDNSYFEGIDNLIYMKDRNDIHRYYITGLTANDAQKKAEDLIKRGFKAVIIDNDEVNRKCKVECSTTTTAERIDIKTLQWIFFDFDRHILRPSSKEQLNKLATVMGESPNYKVEFSAHTDAKGTEEYNQQLSLRRANAAMDYVAQKGIDRNRIKVITNGEKIPVAKNELNGGLDTELGRQFNRRIEIKIYDDKGNQLNLVVPPTIPKELL